MREIAGIVTGSIIQMMIIQATFDNVMKTKQHLEGCSLKKASVEIHSQSETIQQKVSEMLLREVKHVKVTNKHGLTTYTIQW